MLPAIKTNHRLALGLAAAVLACLWPVARADAGTQVYWAHFGGSTLESVPADGSEPPQVLASGASNPLGVAVAATHIYWANYTGDSISRADLDGTGVEKEFISGVNAFALAVTEGHIYWTDADADSIGRANLNGSGIDNGWMPAGSYDAFGIATTPPEATPTSETVTGPSPSTAARACVPVTASAATFTPTPRSGKRVPGVRAMITVSAASQLQVAARLTYKLRGRIRHIDLGSHSLHASPSARLRLPLPAGLRARPALGAKVEVRLRIGATPDGLPGCTSSSPSVRTFKAKIVKVLARR
ncbi:MAG TPA: hypothetical protein VF093_04805 [Solirubrobacterales bacterium]